MRRTLNLLIVLAAVTAALIVPALAVSLNESRPGLWGAAVTTDDEPLKGVAVTLTPKGVSAAPLTMTSNKRGQFVFPRLDLLDEGYDVSVEFEGYFVREYHIRTRRGNREIYQDDEGKLVPKQQTFPPLLYRGGSSNATMKLVLAFVELPARSVADASRVFVPKTKEWPGPCASGHAWLSMPDSASVAAQVMLTISVSR